jgi:hypothetical protein
MANNYGLNDSLSYVELELDSLDAISSPYQIQSPPVVSTTLIEQVKTSDWPQFNLARPLPNVAAIKILEVQIPFSYYVISQENSSFTFAESGFGITATTATITLPSGNYTATTLCTVLSTLLTAASGNGLTYAVTYSTTNGRLSITTVMGVSTFFSLTFGSSGDTGNTNPRLWLGFNQTQTCILGVTGYKTLIAPNALQITGPNYIYVNSTTLGSLATIYLPSGATNLGSGSIGPQLAKIPVNCQPGGVITWQDPGIKLLT